MQVIIGLDVGTKRIGIARLSADATVARMVGAKAVGFVARQGVKKDVAALLARFDSEGFDVQAVVVGLPLTEDGQEQRSTRLARQVADALAEAVEVPVHTQDETYSTLEAEERLRDQGVPGWKWETLVDAEAAAVIVEDWFAARSA